jgi:hypothetical protein
LKPLARNNPIRGVAIPVLPTPAHHSHCFVVTLSYTKLV